MRDISLGTNYPNQDTLAAADTAQLLALGAESATFATPVRFITVTYCSHDVYIAKTSAEAGEAAGGAANDRIFVKALTTGLTLPWDGTDVYFVNAMTGETPEVYVVGHA